MADDDRTPKDRRDEKVKIDLPPAVALRALLKTPPPASAKRRKSTRPKSS